MQTKKSVELHSDISVKEIFIIVISILSQESLFYLDDLSLHLSASMLLVGTDKYHSTRRLTKTLKTFINESKSAEITGFHRNGHFHRRRPISRKMLTAVKS